MKTFHFISVIPEVFDPYANASILGRAQKKKLIRIKAHNLRRWANDKHGTVDDRPYGGGPGMVLKVGPIMKAVQFVKTTIKRSKKGKKTRVILLSTRGRRFTQKEAKRLSRYDHLVFICGRYEGVDERVAEHIADEELCVGDAIISGGEVPAMMIADAVARMVPGVLGKHESLEELKGSYPVYTRPEEFVAGKGRRRWRVPKALLSGDHKVIKEWRKKHGSK